MGKFLTILMGLLMIIGGVFCLFRPADTFMETAGYMLGVIILFDAIGNISTWINAKKYANVSGWYLVSAIISLIFGIVVICSIRAQIITDIVIVYMVISWTIIVGVVRIALAIKMKSLQKEMPEVFKNSRWVVILLTGILLILFAVLCICVPAIMVHFLGVFISLCMIFAGASLLTLGTYVF